MFGSCFTCLEASHVRHWKLDSFKIDQTLMKHTVGFNSRPHPIFLWTTQKSPFNRTLNHWNYGVEQYDGLPKSGCIRYPVVCAKEAIFLCLHSFLAYAFVTLYWNKLNGPLTSCIHHLILDVYRLANLEYVCQNIFAQIAGGTSTYQQSLARWPWEGAPSVPMWLTCMY